MFSTINDQRGIWCRLPILEHVEQNRSRIAMARPSRCRSNTSQCQMNLPQPTDISRDNSADGRSRAEDRTIGSRQNPSFSSGAGSTAASETFVIKGPAI